LKNFKFKYLIQATTKECRARNKACGFPFTAVNYVKAIEELHRIFCEKELFFQCYLRESFILCY